MADDVSQLASKVRRLEQEVQRLKSRMDELTRMLKKASDEAVQRAARRAD